MTTRYSSYECLLTAKCAAGRGRAARNLRAELLRSLPEGRGLPASLSPRRPVLAAPCRPDKAYGQAGDLERTDAHRAQALMTVGWAVLLVVGME